MAKMVTATLLVAAVARRGYMTLCLLDWDGYTVRGQQARFEILGETASYQRLGSYLFHGADAGAS